MRQELTCIECPKGCRLAVTSENNRVLRVEGNECPKGEAYARQEIEDPRRVLTTTVRAHGLRLAWVPVRTSRPIPKARLLEARQALRALRVIRPVAAQEVLARDLLGLGADVLATRRVDAAGEGDLRADPD